MRRRPLATVALVMGGLGLLALLVVWALRFRIATGMVDRKLADAQVSASYRLTKIGPFRERMENVRIGDPAAPDLVARRIDVELGYGWSGPIVRAISVDGVRLRARLDQHGLSLGALDRLLPQSSGGQTKLPDLTVKLRDVRLALATPNGILQAVLEGAGNPQTAFSGTARVTAAMLRLASCRLDEVQANFRITARTGEPQAAGPVQIAHSNCPGMDLGAGRVQLALSSDKIFEKLKLQATLDGFGGRAAGVRFASVEGPVDAAGRIGDLTAAARLNVQSLALPDTARRVTALGATLAGTPVETTGRRAAEAVARLLTRADAQTDLIARLRGTRVAFNVRRVELTDIAGEHIIVTEQGGISWTDQGWRADADIATGGGAMPVLAIELRQAAPGAALAGVARLADYAAGPARLSATPIRFDWDHRRARFDTIVRIDGPIGGGFVRGLSLPVRGSATASGELTLDSGCQGIVFDRLQLTSFIFDPAKVLICGQPIIARSGGGLRIDADTGPLRLTGHTSGGAPIALGASKVRLTEAGFVATGAEARLGPADRQTHVSIATLQGRFGRGLQGKFAGAAGAIANVPLNIADAAGDWRFAGGLLHLNGDIRVSDAAATARFNPLTTQDAVFDLKDNLIRATAALREPTTNAKVADVAISHDLSSGNGHAVIDVRGIAFAPKGLQPEKLTPLTLGVIANVAGTISGNGRIDWNARGVTSSGTFGTERIDLAAAFGPVTGIKGQVRFTDLLGLVSAPDQEATIAEINPGVQVTNGVVHYQLTGQNRVQINDATWPFAGGTLRLEPTTLDFAAEAQRHLTFRIDGLNAAAFVQQLDFPNIAATGTFDGVLPMIFDQSGGRIEAGSIVARKGGGTLAYVGELSNAQLGTMGKLAFDALKAIRYSSLDISLDGRLDGEMVSRVRFTGIREATPEQSLITRLIRNLPFRFNITIHAPFRGLVGSARAYMDPRLLLDRAQFPSAPPAMTTPGEPAIQTKESAKPL